MRLIELWLAIKQSHNEYCDTDIYTELIDLAWDEPGIRANVVWFWLDDWEEDELNRPLV